MSKIAYITSVIALFALYFASLYLTFLAYEYSSLPTKYEFLAPLPVTSVWIILRNRLREAYKSAQR